MNENSLYTNGRFTAVDRENRRFFSDRLHEHYGYFKDYKDCEKWNNKCNKNRMEGRIELALHHEENFNTFAKLRKQYRENEGKIVRDMQPNFYEKYLKEENADEWHEGDDTWD